LLEQLRYFDNFQLEFRIASGEINGLELNAFGHVSGPRSNKVHNWNLAVLTTEKGSWQSRLIDLSRPNWFPWDNKDGEGARTFLRFESLALVPDTVVELRALRLTRAPLFLKPDYELPVTWPVKTSNPDGGITYTSTYQVLNTSGAPANIQSRILSEHRRFKVTMDPPNRQIKNGEMAEFTLKAVMSPADIAGTPELYNESLKIEFSTEAAPESPVRWQGELVRPLSPDIKRQVIAADSDVNFLRERIAAGDTEAKEITHFDRIIRQADELAGVRLDSIPGGHHTVYNSLPVVPGTNRPWQPGSYMPEIVDKETGRREAGTDTAQHFWKEYLAYGGGAESLGLAYLLTGDEKYAKKAVELFELYARQYRDLDWLSRFDPVWNSGPAILASSRVSGSSTYGTNWYFKWHCKLLSMISESAAWKSADKKQIYEGFALPLATELIKFRGGIGNMTDMSNCDILLLGIVFDDAHMVRHALYSDPGLIRRLSDITPDGFSSEGRPINYQLAAMDEYLPAMTYLSLAGLKLDYPKEKLLAAMRMPYQRATLWGDIPISGDMGRGSRIRTIPLADYLVPVFPDEKWLLDIGRNATLSAQARLLRTHTKPNPDAWRTLVEPQPRIFKDAGLAVLRGGERSEDQIMVTLDYGRNVFHSALDRNQVTLSAFGKIFTHGTGSLYNAGSGIAMNPDKRLQTFITHGSLGQNVVLVDGKDQKPCVGELLASSTDPQRQFAVSRVNGIAPGVSHTRAVVLTQGVVVLLDEISSREEHVYDWIYHNFGTLKLGDGWTATASPTPLGTEANYDNIVDPATLHGAGNLQVDWDLSGQQDATDKTKPSPIGLRLWQLPVEGGQVFSGSTGMNNPNTNTLADATPSIIHRVRGNSVKFLTVLEPNKGDSRIQSVTSAPREGVRILLKNGQSFSVSMEQLLAARKN
jgi:hypothetical protein